MGQEPDRIRAEIEQTREQMGETVDALGYKADVKSRAKDSLDEKKESAKESILGVKDKIVGAGQSASDKLPIGGGSGGSSGPGLGERVSGLTGTVSDRTPDSAEVKAKARQAKSVAQENPLGLAIGSLAVGFIAGMVIPSTRVEDEKLGQASDSVIDKVKETGQEALQHGKEVAQEVAQSAQQTVKESGQEHAQQVKQTAQEQASSAGSTSTYQTH